MRRIALTFPAQGAGYLPELADQGIIMVRTDGETDLRQRTPVPDRRHLDTAHEWIAQMYVASRKPEKAKE
jgi:hypothetical protein